MLHFFDVLFARRNEFIQSFIQHTQISLISLFVAAAIAIPLAILLSRYKKIAEGMLQVTGIFQTIPSLALLGILIPMVGIGTLPAVIALIIYGIFPILQSTYTGLSKIDPSLQEASIAFGMTKKERLLKFEIALALPYILSGVRTASVMIIGTATLAALIGAGGLGSFILLGIDRNNMSLILIGAISSAILAVIFSFAIHLLEKARLKNVLIASASILLSLGGSFIYTNHSSAQTKQITIAGKLGAEPDILINMYKLLIEAHSDIQVTLKENFGNTSFLYNALRSGDIDLYPEFTGTITGTLLKKNTNTSNDPQIVYEYAREAILKQDNFVYLKPTSFQDTYAVAVKRAFAKEHNLTKISDLLSIQNQLKGGFSLEFTDREDGWKGLQKLYGLNFPVSTMQPNLRYQAIKNGSVNVVDGYSTDSALKTYDLVTLIDDQKLFPPYQAAPLIRKETLNRFPELESILNKLAGKITEEEMIQMNYQVDVLQKDPAAVAYQFLKTNNLL
ncbi:MAG: ABC transporter permease/substrate-binding protein [Streptococcaceae bacterium]|nr:ABC transporter permease/substrate-binding protein [Streptococcaceae bacterium]